jgi:hypothetical protein
VTLALAVLILVGASVLATLWGGRTAGLTVFGVLLVVLLLFVADRNDALLR